MVFITSASHFERQERLVQSIDLALRDLLRTGDDPLALALYLWIVRAHKLSLIHSDDLARWGTVWISQVLVEGKVTRRKDEQITSAVLAYTALAETKGFSTREGDIRETVQQIVAGILDQGTIPYNRPSYAAILLWAAALLNVQDPRIGERAQTIVSAFREALSGGKVFGIGFVVQLLQHLQKRELLLLLEQSVASALDDPRTNYEDQLYLLHARWLLESEPGPSQQLIELTKQLVYNSPIWPYLMAGTEEIPAAGDGNAPVGISHLYRALLLDVLLMYQHAVEVQATRFIAENHRGRHIVRLSAFGFGIVLEVLAWLGVAMALVPSFDVAKRYWLLHEYTAMTSHSALLYLLCVLLATLLLFVTPVFTWTWASLLLHSKVESDRQIAGVLGRRVFKVFWLWLSLIALGVLINFVIGVFQPAFQHAVGG